jgi:hypothetical protein
MAFSEIFGGRLSTAPFPLGEVSSNVFIVKGEEGSIWAKVRVGIYASIPGMGLVEVSNTYIPVGDNRMVMGVVPISWQPLAGPLLAFAEVIYRYPQSQTFPCKIFSGAVEDMIYDPINPNAIADASATKNETSSDIINTSATAVVSVKPANLNRTGGFLSWQENGSIYIGFGGPPARKATSQLTKGSKIDIPNNFTGEIFVDWNGNQVAANSAPSQSKILQCIEYVR